VIVKPWMTVTSLCFTLQPISDEMVKNDRPTTRLYFEGNTIIDDFISENNILNSDDIKVKKTTECRLLFGPSRH